MTMTTPRLAHTKDKSMSNPIDRKNTIIKMLWIGMTMSSMPTRRLLLPMVRPARNAP